MSAVHARGFTIVEIMITLAVLGILLMVGVPAFATWVENTRIRTTTHNIQGGLQLAKSEAVRRNLNVKIVIGGATGPAEWTVSAITPGGDVAVETRSGQEGANINTVVGIAPPGATTLTFNGLGRIVSPNGDGSASITQIDVCPRVADPEKRPLRIAVGTGGTVRMCDPAVAAGDPRACQVAAASTC